MADLDVQLPAIVAGDPRAFGQWMAGAEPRVRLSLQSFAARVDVEAVVQETFLRVWQVAPRFVPDGAPDGLVRLAVRIARNLAVNEMRRARMQPEQVEALERRAEAAAEAPEPPDPLLRRLIARCREALPAQPARALAARLGDGGEHPDATLAAAVGMTVNTFVQNVRRARLALAECLGRHGVTVPGVMG